MDQGNGGVGEPFQAVQDGVAPTDQFDDPIRIGQTLKLGNVGAGDKSVRLGRPDDQPRGRIRIELVEHHFERREDVL